MVKNVFIYLVLIALVGVAAWLFIRRGEESFLSTSPSPSVAMTASPVTTTLPGGLIIEDVQIGQGAAAKAGDLLSVHYTGRLENGTVFDSSYPRGQAFLFQLGAGQVIQGWDQGLVGMRVGGKRKLTIPPALAYGDRAVGSVIPPNSTLLFEVELLDARTQAQ